jgi:hypothetical protein
MKEECRCGFEIRPDIWLCPHYRYRKGKQEFTSVSKVIRTLLPADYSAVDPVVLETARLRGVFVDTYFSEYLTDPANVIAPKDVGAMVRDSFPRDKDKYADDVVRRIEMLLNWWTVQKFKATDVQRTVFSEQDGVAGTFDIGLEEMILDLKVVSDLQPSYKLQTGAYITYDTEGRDPGVIHVTKDKVKLVRYDAKQCRDSWKSCVAWYRASRELVPVEKGI